MLLSLCCSVCQQLTTNFAQALLVVVSNFPQFSFLDQVQFKACEVAAMLSQMVSQMVSLLQLASVSWLGAQAAQESP